MTEGLWEPINASGSPAPFYNGLDVVLRTVLTPINGSPNLYVVLVLISIALIIIGLLQLDVKRLSGTDIGESKPVNV